MLPQNSRSQSYANYSRPLPHATHSHNSRKAPKPKSLSCGCAAFSAARFSFAACLASACACLALAAVLSCPFAGSRLQGTDCMSRFFGIHNSQLHASHLMLHQNSSRPLPHATHSHNSRKAPKPKSTSFLFLLGFGGPCNTQIVVWFSWLASAHMKPLCQAI